MQDVIVIGSLNMDLVIHVQKMPELGETIRGSDLLTIPGGKGANQAAAASKLGNHVLMVGRVGGDAFGAVLKNNLSSLGVNTEKIFQDEKSSSGTAVIVVDDSGNNTIVTSAGANGNVSINDLENVSSVLEGSRMLLLQLEIPINVVYKAIDMAFARKVPVVLNPSPMADISHEILQKVNYLVLNEVEAKGISGKDVVDIESAKSAAQKILSTGTENVIITLGENGAVFASHSTTAHVPAIKVKPVDTTAAGDAFTAGFVTGILKGFSLIDAVRYGNCAGALTATKNGAQTSLPDCAAVDKLFYSGRKEI